MAKTANAFRQPLGAGYTRTSDDNDKLSGGKYHVGEDWAGKAGGRVSSAASGVVISAGPAGTWGNLVVVEHTLPDGNKVTSIYGHLDKVYVKAGQEVGIGDQLGTVGSTGNSTGPHLHFSIYAGDLNGATPIGHADRADQDLQSSGYVDPSGFIANHPEVTFSTGNDTKVLWYAGSTWKALGGNDIVHGSAGADTIHGDTGNDQLNGNAGNDQLFGGEGADVLSGGYGRDLLVGGAGRDVMTGGADRDTFDFNLVQETGKTASTRDVIRDFTTGEDKLDLSTIDASSRNSGDQAFRFIGNTAFNGKAGELRYAREDRSGTANDATIVYGDVDGDKLADFQIELTGLKSLGAGDFLL
jgi:Ca2+-binding RTX toxin-like protein